MMRAVPRFRRYDGFFERAASLRIAALVLALSGLASSAEAASPSVEAVPGASQKISHKSSASRDTALPGYQMTPYTVLTAGIDVALVGIDFDWVSLRFGFFGMLELESSRPIKLDDDAESQNALLPSAGSNFWRGAKGFQAAIAFDEAGRRWFGRRGLFEATLGLRHESEHYTGSNSGDPGVDYSDVPHIGDFLLQDFAARIPSGRVDFELRLQQKWFLPIDAGQANGRLRAYSIGPGFDFVVRWRLWHWLHPFSSTFGEYLLGNQLLHEGKNVRVPDNYLLRNLTGVIFPGPYGEVQVFTSISVGHGKGLRVFDEELLWGGGVRIAPF